MKRFFKKNKRTIKRFKKHINLQNMLIISTLFLATVRFAIVPIFLKSTKLNAENTVQTETTITTILKSVLAIYNINELWQHQKDTFLQVHIPTKFRFIDFHLTLDAALNREGYKILYANRNPHETRYEMSLGNNSDTLNVVFLKKDYLPNKTAFIAIIIDDFGYHLNGLANDFIRYPKPITLSIIPHLKYSADVAREGSMVEKEIMIHMPMEPLSAAYDDDALMLLTSQSSGEWRLRLKKAFSLLKSAKGLNNHQGSKATADEKMMRIVLDEIKSQGLFFIDSKTNVNSVALKLARKMKIPSAENNIFLDANDDTEFIEGQFDRLAEMSKSRGYAIGIGHVRKNTFKVLEEKLPELEARGFKIVSVSELVQ
jgi:polysaccharide deacetylase 2 family uncharacterized protein YibQ